MSKVFIDAGSFDGRTTRLFRKKYGQEWIVHCFEPDPRIVNEEPGIILHREAVWTSDGEMDLHLGKPESSSLFAEKTTGEVGKHGSAKVRCVDFSRWLSETVGPQDEVIVKLNIEGAEYSVLRRMVEHGTVSLISKLFVEWHYKKILMQEREHHGIIALLTCAGVELHSINGTRWLR